MLHPRLRLGTPERPELGGVLVNLLLAAFAGAVVLAIWFAATGGFDLWWLRLAFVAVVLPIPWVTRVIGTVRAVRIYAVTAVWLMVTTLSAASGGATSSALYLYAMLPFLSASLGNPRSAALASALALGSIGLFYLLHGAGVVFPAHGRHADTLDVGTLAVATGVVYALTLTLLSARRAARRRVQEAVSAVAAANARGLVARARLERAEEAKRVVLTRVGPGFKGPIEAVVSAAHALGPELPPALRDHAAMVERAADQLLGKLSGFMAYTDAWNAVPATGPAIDLDALVAATVARHAAAASAKGLALVTVAQDVPEPRHGDAARLGVVLDALIDNAIKFSPAGRVELTVAPGAGDLVTFTVLDTGPGIAPALGDRVFEPFFQADLSTARSHGGTGLGLALARRLAEGLGGTLTCLDRAPGTGACFVLAVPLPRTLEARS